MMMVTLSRSMPNSIEKDPMSSHLKEISSFQFAAAFSKTSSPRAETYLSIIDVNIYKDKTRVVTIAIIETQSPCLGRRFPTNI